MSLNTSPPQRLWLLLGTALLSQISPSPLIAAENARWSCTATATGWDCNGSAAAPEPPLAAAPLAAAVRQGNRPAPAYRPHALDWVRFPANQAAVCRGYYAEPPLSPIPAASNGEPLRIEAGFASTTLGGISTLSGGVILRQGDRQLSASKAELDRQSETATFEREVEYREPGVLLVSDEARIELATEQSEFNQAQFVMHSEHLRGRAARIYRDAQAETLSLEQGLYTFCPPGDDDWTLHADNVTLNQTEGQGVAKHAVLKVSGVPLLYSPYMTFPIDDRRRSGLLSPDISYTNINGLDIALPYYLNLASNYDDTLTPRYISKRGEMLENEFRYLGGWSNNVFSAAYLPNDKLFGADRWLGALRHQGTPAKGYSTLIDVTAVSDNEYFDDLTTNLEVSRQSHLDKRAEIAYGEQGWSFTARLHTFQTIDDSITPYRRLPQLLYNSEDLLSYGELTQQAELVHFDRDLTGLTGSDRITGNRLHYHPGFSLPLRQTWGFFVPKAELWLSQYQLSNQLSGRDDRPHYAVPILSLDSGLFFERELDSGGIQTLEPRLFALYVPDKDQDDAPDFDTSLKDFNYSYLFQSNRFSGRDRIGDSQQLSLGVTTRLYQAGGFEWFNLSIGQAYYYDDRNVTVDDGAVETAHRSDIIQLANWYLNSRWRLALENVFDQASLRPDKSNLRLRYNGGLDNRFDFSYRYEAQQRDQIETSAIWPLSNRWTAMGRWQYDLDGSENLDTALGIEYESCCWSLRLAARRWLTDTDKYDNGLFLRFLLKGLGSLRSSKDEFLNDIYGFKERDEQEYF